MNQTQGIIKAYKIDDAAGVEPAELALVVGEAKELDRASEVARLERMGVADEDRDRRRRGRDRVGVVG